MEMMKTPGCEKTQCRLLAAELHRVHQNLTQIIFLRSNYQAVAAPVAMPKIIVVRHGQAEHNVAFDALGDAAYEDPLYRDSKLTRAGQEQTVTAGKDIAANISSKACALWSSPLTRCIQTSSNIMASVSVPPEHVFLHDNLLEKMGRGHICNLRDARDDIVSKWPLFNADALPDHGPLWAGEEPQTSVRGRMQMLVLHLRQMYAMEELPVIVVSHHDALLDLTGMSLKNGEHAVIEG